MSLTTTIDGREVRYQLETPEPGTEVYPKTDVYQFAELAGPPVTLGTQQRARTPGTAARRTPESPRPTCANASRV